MTHNWYKPGVRHYGRKPNTKRARGLHNKNWGKKVGPRKKYALDTMPAADVDTNVESVELPQSKAAMKKYVQIYNWYIEKYQLYYDREYCIELAVAAFAMRRTTIERAIKVCKYILAETYKENVKRDTKK